MNAEQRHHPILVIKLGGTEGVDFSAICQDVVQIIQNSTKRLVLVHGGSSEANLLAEALHYPARFITSPSGYTSRYTDRKTLEIFAMAVKGKVNALLVEQLQQLGVNALGLSGVDGRLLLAERKDTVVSLENGRKRLIHDDYSGKITSVNTHLLLNLLEAGYLPVIAPLAVSTKGEMLNVDGDRAAAMIAAALRAEILLLLTAAPGLLREFPDPNTLIPKISVNGISQALEFAQGRMKKKVLGAQEALQGGVSQVVIADGRLASPIQNALQGNGTWFTNS
ncbi:MAG: [LysW]-aminoadipate kinase [Anaerolineales bacterium]